MFALGPIETLIVIVLVYLAFKHIIARRFPGIFRAFNFIFFTAAALMLLFGVLTHYR